MPERMLNHSCSAKFNANQPLLHLPAIAAPSSRAQKPNLGPNKQKGGAAEVTEDTHLNLTHQNLFYVNALQSVTRVPLAFRLPEVCRQIYSETALTAYRENTFVYGELHWMYRSAKLQLSAAQRRAMTSIELERVTFSAMSILNPYPESIRWNGLPNVQTVFVTSRAMRCMELDLTRSTFDVEKTFWGKEQWRKFVTDTMQSREGSDLQVVFR